VSSVSSNLITSCNEFSMQSFATVLSTLFLSSKHASEVEDSLRFIHPIPFISRELKERNGCGYGNMFT